MLARHPLEIALEIAGVEASTAENATRVAAASYDLIVVVTNWSGQLLRREAHNGHLIRRFAAYLRSRDWYFSARLFGGVLRRRADRLIGVSVYEAHRFEHAVGRQVIVIRNGGGLTAPATPVQQTPGRIVSVGRLEQDPGHHRLVERLPEPPRSNHGAHLEIFGSGPYEPELPAPAKRLGVSDKVSLRFVPLLDHALRDEKVAAALAPPLETPLVPDRELLPTWETFAAGILDTYRPALGP